MIHLSRMRQPWRWQTAIWNLLSPGSQVAWRRKTTGLFIRVSGVISIQFRSSKRRRLVQAATAIVGRYVFWRSERHLTRVSARIEVRHVVVDDFCRREK